MHQQSVLIEDLAVVLCVAAFVTVLFQKIKQPTVLGYLIAGIIVGPYTPPFSLIDDEFEIKILAELGVIFLMFSLGLEFTFSKLTRLGLPAIIIGVIEVVVMLIIGFFAGEMLGWTSYESLLLGAALSISSTTIIIKALEEYNLKRYSFAQLMVGVLLIEDLLAILLLVYVSTIGTSGHLFSFEILSTSIKLLLVISSWFLVGYFALPYIMRKIQNYINHETLTIISVGLCLFLSSVAVYFNYSAALGAFIMGSILAETPLVRKIEELTLPIRDIFAAVFFVSVGMLINPWLIIHYWPYVVILSLVTIFGKILTSGAGAILAGQSVSDSIRIGFSMAQIGEFSFIIIGLGSSLMTTDGTLYPIIVAISAITTFATPYLMKLSLKITDNIDQKLPENIKYLLMKYNRWLNPSPSPVEEQHAWKGKNIVRFLINGIIIAIIMTVCSKVLVARFLPIINEQWPFQLAFWQFIILLAAPFIWAMLFAHQSVHPGYRSAVRLITWTITFLELAGFAILYMTFPVLAIPIFVGLLLYFVLFFHLIKTCYAWLENNLINNITRQHEIDEETLQKLAPWDNELVIVKVTDQFPFIGQSLAESRLRPSYNINIVAIKRLVKTIWLPNAKERILPEDELIILGEKNEVEYFRESTQPIKAQGEPSEQRELEIESLHIDDTHVLVNHLIADPIVKEYINGLIVGLDRQGDHILNPPPSTVLEAGDVLLYISKK